MTDTLLTEADWSRVFHVRCKNQRGEKLSRGELDLCRRAVAQDRGRFRDMNEAVVQVGRAARGAA